MNDESWGLGYNRLIKWMIILMPFVLIKLTWGEIQPLVDYTPSVKEQNELKNQIRRKNIENINTRTDGSGSGAGLFDISLIGSQWEKNTSTSNHDPKRQLTLDINYHATQSLQLNYEHVQFATHTIQKSEWGKGSLSLKYNWLQLGTNTPATTLNFIGGVTLPINHSDYAANTLGKLAGIESEKKGMGFKLSLHSFWFFPGTAKSNDAMPVGVYQRVGALAEYALSSDIFTGISGAYTQIKASHLNYSTLSPYLILTPYLPFKFTFSLLFRVKRPTLAQEERLRAAKLYTLPGAFHNAIYLGMALSV